MRDKKTIILIVLTVIAVIILSLNFMPRRKGSPAAPGDSKQASSKVVLSAQRRAKRSAHTSWKRNPFVSTGVPGSTSSLALSGILSAGGQMKAMVGDAIVGKGDKIGGNTVVEVRKDRVILNDGTKDFELKLAE